MLWVRCLRKFESKRVIENDGSLSVAGGCCAPNRLKPAGRIYQDYGENYRDDGTKIVGIADTPLIQTIAVEGAYMRHLTDDHAMVCIQNCGGSTRI